MTDDEQTTVGVEWFKSISEDRKQRAFEMLLHFAIRNETVGVWSEESIRGFIEDRDDDIVVDYEAPYYRQSGQAIA